MHIKIDITENDIRKIIADHLSKKLGDISIDPSNIRIEAKVVRVRCDAAMAEVKSKQNYKSEWETANFRAVFEKS